MPDNDSSSKQEATVIEYDNTGSTVYVILSIDGEGAAANLNEENTALILCIGDRFRLTTSPVHPIIRLISETAIAINNSVKAIPMDYFMMIQRLMFNPMKTI